MQTLQRGDGLRRVGCDARKRTPQEAVLAHSGFAVLLVVVTFVPPFISFCGAFHSFYGVMKEAPEPDSEKAAKESAAEPESSPESPLEQDEPPHEDEEQPVVITR